MAIKKPVTKRRDEDEEEVVPKKGLKSTKRPAPEPEEEEEEDTESEEEDEEETKPVKKGKRPAPVEEDDDEEEEEPAPKKKSKLKSKKTNSLADIFDSTKPGRGLFPVGDFTVKVVGLEFDGEIAEEGEEQEDLKVKITYEGLEDDEEIAGKKISQWYQIWMDGEAGQGIPFLKGDLDVLGYEDVVLADLQDIFDDVLAEEPLVIIKVKEKNGYTNAYLQGLAEGE